jgi:hypothetical protein
MNSWNRASTCLLVLIVAAAVLPDGLAHDRQTEHHPNPGTLPGQPPPVWFPAMPTNPVDITTPNGVFPGHRQTLETLLPIEKRCPAIFLLKNENH